MNSLFSEAVSENVKRREILWWKEVVMLGIKPFHTTWWTRWSFPPTQWFHGWQIATAWFYQIRTLSDLQGAAALQAADPSLQVKLRNRLLHIWWDLPFLQAAYIAKLHQQAASIKNLLKLLNAGETGLNNPGDLTAVANVGSFENVWESSSNNNVNLNYANFAHSGVKTSFFCLIHLWSKATIYNGYTTDHKHQRKF